MRAMEASNYDDAHRYANECLAEVERLPSSTLDDVAATRTHAGGVPLPDYFHEGVVRERLGGLLDR
ncbi:hypothetical protein ABN034_12580 [Actinopolymorpha sp. B11F2]